MKKVLYPTLTEVLTLHRSLIERFGGADGGRDLGLLESALVRPRTGYYATLSLQAAALLQSLAQNHPFVDGNKRVAFATTAIFLRMNGFRIMVDAEEGEVFVIDSLIKKRATLEKIATWLEKRMREV
jgi:death-on-curing protein